MTSITGVNFLTETSSAAVNAARRVLKDFYRPDVTSDDRGDWNVAFNSVLPSADQIAATQRWSRSREIYALLDDPFELLHARFGGIAGAQLLPITPDTVFTDEAGTTPADFGQTVGAIRDMGGTIRATQATPGSRPTYARQPASGIRNILPADTTNITSGTGWGTLRASRAAAPDSATGEPATTLTATETNVNGAFLQAGAIALAEGQYTLSAVLKGSGWAMLQIALSTDNAQTVRAWFNLGTGATGTANFAGAAFSASSNAIAAVGDGYRCSITFTVAASGSFFLRPFVVDGNASNAVTNGAAIRIEQPQFEAGATATAYQRRVSSFDITETGVRDIYALAFDGIDDHLVLGTAFNPAGAYTLAAGVNVPGGAFFPAFGRVSGSARFGVTSANLPVLEYAASNRRAWTPGLTGRQSLIARVRGTADYDMRRNGVDLTEDGALAAGNIFPAVNPIDALGRNGSDYGNFRLFGCAIALPLSPTDADRNLIERVNAYAAGVTLP